MKKLLFFLPAFLLVFAFSGQVNLNNKFPTATVQKLAGGTISTSEFSKTGKPTVVSFWSTTCVPCIKELIAINKNYEQWKKETGVEVYAIATDDKRFENRIPTLVKKKGWAFPILKDTDKKLFNQLKVPNVPYTVVLDKTGKIVYEHNSYKAGDEKEIYRVLKSLK